jgi:ribosomal protein S1
MEQNETLTLELTKRENQPMPVEFDWESYSGGGNRLIPNKKVKTKHSKDKVYCHEPYAQKMYDAIFENTKFDNIQKDLVDGSIYEVSISPRRNDESEMIGTVIGSMQTVFINVDREKNFLKSINYEMDFVRGSKATVLVTKGKDGTYFGSIEKGYKMKLRRELMDSLKDRKSAYLVDILEINTGGFIVNLSGLRCFMPGSLAAANKIHDDQFQSMIGKTIYVMVESYLDSSDMFVVSNKRYIKTILPQKIKELDYNKKYKGKITGCAPYGCFVEWDEIFTGLIHSSEMDPDLSARVKNIRPGEEVEFWIKEIKDSTRIILSQKGPDIERVKYKEFKEKWEDKEYGGARIKDIKSFGTFVELEDGIIGMLPPREFKKFGRQEEGNEIDVYIKNVDAIEKKIYCRYIDYELQENL